MTVYGIAQLTIGDRADYDRYAAEFMPILRQYGGTPLVADEHPRVIEGTWGFEKVVMVAFDDEASFERWYHSPEYQRIVGGRLAGAQGPLLLVRGVERQGRFPELLDAG